jgi:hypothetical protein
MAEKRFLWWMASLKMNTVGILQGRGSEALIRVCTNLSVRKVAPSL